MYDQELRRVRQKLEAAGMTCEPIAGGYRLDFVSNGAPMVVRVMDDPGHSPRVHLRSVSDAGEVTITTQRMSAVKKLVDYAAILKTSAQRAAKM